ncbi:MAG: GntR family transcriptional regulator [Janthinobacterium lividum]
MTGPVPLSKPDAVRERIVAEIRSGELARGERLPGEHALATRFKVSRATVRQALAELQRGGYIATQAGSGSFVTYDGRDIAPTQSWSAEFAAHGLASSSRIMRFEVTTVPELSEWLKLDSDKFLAVDRVRVVDKTPVSLEHSRLPFGPAIADLTADGLVDGSLTTSLVRRGLVVARFEEWARLTLLSPAEAEALERVTGDPWLQLSSVGRDDAGEVVEFVTSWLDPNHFHLHHDGARSTGAGSGQD